MVTGKKRCHGLLEAVIYMFDGFREGDPNESIIAGEFD